MEAILAYYSQLLHLNKDISALRKIIKDLDPLRVVLFPIEKLRKAFQTYFEDESSCKLTYDLIMCLYLSKR